MQLFDLLPIGDGGERHHGNPSWSSGCNGVPNSSNGPFGQPVSMSYYQKMRWPFFEMASLVGLGRFQLKNEILLNWKHEELVNLFCNWLTKG